MCIILDFFSTVLGLRNLEKSAAEAIFPQLVQPNFPRPCAYLRCVLVSVGSAPGPAVSEFPWLDYSINSPLPQSPPETLGN